MATIPFPHPLYDPTWTYTVGDRSVPVDPGTGRVIGSGSTPVPSGDSAPATGVDWGNMNYTQVATLLAQNETLISLLRLTEEERAFVRRGLADPSRDFFLVLADWLEEQGRDAASARFRAMGEGRAA